MPEEEEENESDEGKGEQTASSSGSQSEDEGISATPTKRHTNHHASDTNYQQPIDRNHGQSQGVDLLAIMEAIDAENMAVESTNSQTDVIEPSFENADGAVIIKFTPKDSESDGESEKEKGGGTAEGGTKFESEGGFGRMLQSPSRKFVDFSHTQRNEASLKVAKKAKKRAQVYTRDSTCTHKSIIIQSIVSVQDAVLLHNNTLCPRRPGLALIMRTTCTCMQEYLRNLSSPSHVTPCMDCVLYMYICTCRCTCIRYCFFDVRAGVVVDDRAGPGEPRHV